MDTNKKDAAKRDKNEVVRAKDYGEYAGRGFQNQTQEDVAIPFVNLLQSNSPEVLKDHEQHIKGAEAGMFINTVTKELFKEIELTPSVTRHLFVEWVPRDNGGGLIGFHACNSDVVKAAKAVSTKFGKFKNGENDLVETFEIWGAGAGEGAPAGEAPSTNSATYAAFHSSEYPYRPRSTFIQSIQREMFR